MDKRDFRQSEIVGYQKNRWGGREAKAKKCQQVGWVTSGSRYTVAKKRTQDKLTKGIVQGKTVVITNLFCHF